MLRKKRIPIKTAEEISILVECGNILAKTHGYISEVLKEGISTSHLDKLAEDYIRDCGALPAFKGLYGFPGTLCISINDCIVHGLPGKYQLKSGDVVSIDCGVIWNSFYTDSAYTYGIGEISNEVLNFLDCVEESLYKGIDQALVKNKIGDIGFAIESNIKKFGYNVVEGLVGHGVGKSLHEYPCIPNEGKPKTGLSLLEGVVIAIEPMASMGYSSTKLNKTEEIFTKDGALSAHYEQTIAVTNGGPVVLTKFDCIKSKIVNW